MAAETVLHSTQSRGSPRSTLREGEQKGQIYSRSLRSGAGEPRECSGEMEGYEAPGKTSNGHTGEQACQRLSKPIPQPLQIAQQRFHNTAVFIFQPLFYAEVACWNI